MRKSILNCVISALLFFCAGSPAKASHIVGADLYYTHISGNTYQISIALYGDCGPLSAAAFSSLPISTPQICVYKGNTLVTTVSLGLPSPTCGTEITHLCPGDSSTCVSLTATLPGIKKFLYSATYTLPDTSSVWRFVYTGNNGGTSATVTCPGLYYTGASTVPSSAGRAAAITNILSGTTMQLIDTLNNSFAANSNPILTVAQQTYFCAYLHNEFDPGAVDPDSDSLFITLTDATNGAAGCGSVGGSATYTGTCWPSGPAVSGTFPLNVVNIDSFSFSNETGNIIFHPLSERSVVVYNIREFRGGVFIGSSQREMTVLTVNCAVTFPCDSLAIIDTSAAPIDSSLLYITQLTGKNRVSISPNPATNALTISIDEGIYNSFVITNTTGQMMLQQQITGKQKKVNIGWLPQGMYYITIKGPQNIITKKFVKMQ